MILGDYPGKGTKVKVARSGDVIPQIVSVDKKARNKDCKKFIWPKSCPVCQAPIIKTEEEDVFFHRSDIEGVEFDSLSEGQEVEFEKGQGRDGRPRAVKVRLSQSKSE